MSELKNKELLEQIKPLLKDESWWVRSPAISALRLIVQADPSLAKEAIEQIKSVK